MPKEDKNDYQLNVLCIIFIIFILIFSTSPVYCATNYYYYLQVGSFRSVPRALHFAQKLHSLNENTLIRGEDIPALGYWYRVYLGPFPSYREADHKRQELLKKRFYAENAFIHKKTFPIQSNLSEEAESVIKGVRTAPEKEAVKISPPEEVTVSLNRSEIELPSLEEKPSMKERPLAREPDQEESSTIEETAATILSEATLELSEKPTLPKMQNGNGRNIAQGKLAFGVKHIFLDTQTEVIERKLITSDDTTTVSIGSINKNEFPTSMHLDTIRIRFGLTGYLEIFADIGAAYDKLSDPEFAYGGGVRLNLFEAAVHSFGKFYLALQGEYLDGKLNEEYITDTGYRWDKETAWQEFTIKMELGVTKSKFTAYVGGLYFLYREDTDRRLLENIPAPFTSYVIQDKLEEEYNYGAYGGVEYQVTPAMLINIEGQIINQNRVSGTLEYQF